MRGNKRAVEDISRGDIRGALTELSINRFLIFTGLSLDLTIWIDDLGASVKHVVLCVVVPSARQFSKVDLVVEGTSTTDKLPESWSPGVVIVGRWNNDQFGTWTEISC